MNRKGFKVERFSSQGGGSFILVESAARIHTYYTFVDGRGDEGSAEYRTRLAGGALPYSDAFARGAAWIGGSLKDRYFVSRKIFTFADSAESRRLVE